ncbi:MAG: AAA family ATPase [Patescibacteria group bacterium]|nr:AAA family ATPase [Patescibacteria group bacterium]
MSKKIIAFPGLAGSGKTEVIEYLMEKHSWPKVYFGEVTFDELKKRGLEVSEKNERVCREDLRAQHGNLHYANQVIKKIDKINSDFILVESLYSWEEFLRFKEKFGKDFITIAIYSSPKTRYARLSNRAVRPLTEEEAQSRDYAQIENIHQAGPIAMSDFTVINEGEKPELFSQIDEVIKKIL